MTPLCLKIGLAVVRTAGNTIDILSCHEWERITGCVTLPCCFGWLLICQVLDSHLCNVGMNWFSSTTSCKYKYTVYDHKLKKFGPYWASSPMNVSSWDKEKEPEAEDGLPGQDTWHLKTKPASLSWVLCIQSSHRDGVHWARPLSFGPVYSVLLPICETPLPWSR